MKAKFATLSSLIILGCAPLAAAADGSKPTVKPGDTPAARILQQMAGTWDEEVEMADGKKVHGTTTGRFVMDGNWLETETVIPIDDKNKVQHLTLWGWDEKGNVFKSWMFSPNSPPLESTATYDEKLKSFTCTGKTANGATVDVVTSMVSADRQEWNVKITGKDGKEIKFKGVNTRKKE
jgi:hypothetical protein